MFSDFIFCFACADQWAKEEGPGVHDGLPEMCFQTLAALIPFSYCHVPTQQLENI